MDRNKLINAIIRGDHGTMESTLPPRVADLYQIGGCGDVFRMDGTKVPPDELTRLERSNAFVTVRTYPSHDEVPEARHTTT